MKNKKEILNLIGELLYDYYKHCDDKNEKKLANEAMLFIDNIRMEKK